jgi:hypothetical protein
MISIPSNPDLPDPNVSLQKPNSILPDLPPIDEYGSPLPQLLSEPRSCQAGWGLSWLTKAFTMFKEQFLLWLGIGVVYLIILMVGSFVPVINLIFSFITFVFIGGIILGCDAQATGRELRFDHLFSAFNTHLLPLVVLFLLYLVAVIVAIIPMMIVFGGMTMMWAQQPSDGAIMGILLGVLLALLLLVPALMAIWFAPALIVLHNVSPVEAMKMSFKGCLKNTLPFLVFGLVGPIVMILIAIFNLGLGVLVLLPIGIITYYTSYRDVWTDQPLSAT